MLKAQGGRWAVLLLSLAATIAAIVFPLEESPVSPSTPARAAAIPVNNEPTVAPSELQRDWLAAEDNPFAPRGWSAPPAPPVPARVVAAVMLDQAPPVAAPAALPFRFIGRMSDGNDHVIYLGQGEQLVSARQGDVLDGHYKVVAIRAAQMEFEDTTSGGRHVLPLPVQDK